MEAEAVKASIPAYLDDPASIGDYGRLPDDGGDMDARQADLERTC
jgi:hypothetical protein